MAISKVYVENPLIIVRASVRDLKFSIKSRPEEMVLEFDDGIDETDLFSTYEVISPDYTVNLNWKPPKSENHIYRLARND
jgi:hypothetical protein